MSHRWKRMRRVSVTGPGEGYQTKPNIVVAEPTAPKQEAQGTATLSGSGVDKVNLDSGGNFYSNPPAVTLSAPDSGGSQATAVALINEGEVIKVEITDSGSGYSSPPVVTVAKSTDPKSDFGAQVSLDFDSATGTVTAINVVDSGRFYDSANPPTVTIDKPFPNQDFEIGQDVKISGVNADSTAATVTGEVSQWIESSGKLTVIHIANDTDELVEPSKNSIVEAVNGSARSLVTEVVTPAIAGDVSSEFDDQASDFLDFTESNPFGEPEAATVALETAAAIVTQNSTPDTVIIRGTKEDPSFEYPLEYKIIANGVSYQFDANGYDTRNYFQGIKDLNVPGLQFGLYVATPPNTLHIQIKYTPQTTGDTITLAGAGMIHLGLLEGTYGVEGDRADLSAGDSATAIPPAQGGNATPPVTDIILQGNISDPSFATNKTYSFKAGGATYTYGPTTNANRNFYQGIRNLGVTGLEVSTHDENGVIYGLQLKYTPNSATDTLELLDTNGWVHVGLAEGEYVVGTNTAAPPPPAQGFMSDSDYTTAVSQTSTGMIWDSSPISIGTSTIRYEEKYNFAGHSSIVGIPRNIIFADNGKKLFYVAGGAYSNSAYIYGMNLNKGYDLTTIDSATGAGILDLNSHFSNILDSEAYGGQYDEFNMLDMWFNPDGTKMWVSGNSWDTVIQFALDSAWNPMGTITPEHKIATGYMGALQTGTLINNWAYDANLQMSNYYSHEWIDSGRTLISGALGSRGTTIKQEFSTPYDISTATTSFTAQSIGDYGHTLYSDSDSDGKEYANDALKLGFADGGQFNNDGTERYFIHQQFSDSDFAVSGNGLGGWRVNLVKATLDTPYDITTMSFANQTEITNLSDSSGAPTAIRGSGSLTFHPDGSKFYWMGTSSNETGTPNYSDWSIFEFSGTGDSAGSTLITTPDITVAPMIQGTYVPDSAGSQQGQGGGASASDSATLSSDSAVSGNSIFQGVTGDGITVGGNHPSLLYPDSNIRISTPHIADLEFTDSTPSYGLDNGFYAGNYRGWSVALTKDLIVTGIPNRRRDSPSGISRGQGGYSVQLNNSTQTMLQQWINGRIMEPNPGLPDGTSLTNATNEDEWGMTVAASGKTFAIASPHYDNGASGSGYTGVNYGGVWVKNMEGLDSQGASGYQVESRNDFHSTNSYALMAPSPTNDGYFGSQVAMDSDFDRLVIGEYGRTNRQGRVYSYRLSTGELLGSIDNPYAENIHEFGRRIALSGDYLAVADYEYEDSDTNFIKDGAVHLFNLNDNSYLRSFHGDPSFKQNQRFGNEIAMEGTNLSVLDFEGQWYVFNIVTGNRIAGPIIDPRMDSLGDTVFTTQGNVSPEFSNVKMSGNIAALMSRDGYNAEQDPMGVDSNGEMVKRIYYYDINNLHNNDSTPISYITRPSSPTYDINWGQTEGNGNSYSKVGLGFDFYGYQTLVGAPYHSQPYTVSNYRKTKVGEVYLYGEIADSAGAADFRPGYETWRTYGPTINDFSLTSLNSMQVKGLSNEPNSWTHFGPANSMWFNGDGTTMYLGTYMNEMMTLDLATPYSLNGLDTDFSNSFGNNVYPWPQSGYLDMMSISFDSAGTKLLASAQNNTHKGLSEFALTTPYDLNTVTGGPTNTKNLGNWPNNPLNNAWSSLRETEWASQIYSPGRDFITKWIDGGTKVVILMGGQRAPNYGRMLILPATTPYDVTTVQTNSPLSAYDFEYEMEQLDADRFGAKQYYTRYWNDFHFSEDGTTFWLFYKARNPAVSGQSGGPYTWYNDLITFTLSTPFTLGRGNVTYSHIRKMGVDADTSIGDYPLSNIDMTAMKVVESQNKIYFTLNNLLDANGNRVYEHYVDIGIGQGYQYYNTNSLIELDAGLRQTGPYVPPANKVSVERFAYDSTQEFAYSTVEANYGLELSPDGKTIVMKDRGINDWRAYSMTTAWDLTTASRDTNKEPTLTMDSTSHKMKEFGMTFNDDWSKLYTTRIGDATDIYKNEISQYDISGGASTYSIDRIDDAIDSNREGFWGTLAFFATVQDQTGFNRSQKPDNIQFADSGRRLYWTSLAGSPHVISQWHLSAPYTIDLNMYDSGALFYPAITNNEVYTQNLGMHVNYDGTRLYMLANSSVVDSAMHPGAPDRGIGIYQFDLADSWDITSATWDSSKFLQIENIPHGNVTDATGDIFSTKDYLYTTLTIDGTTSIRRYSIVDSSPPPPRSGSDSDGNGYATSLNWTVTVQPGPLYEDSATEGNVFYLEGDNSNFNY